jgi:hypothetical protein
MAKYRKRPVVIEAFQWTADENQTDDPVWIVEAIRQDKVHFENEGTLEVAMIVHTLEGRMKANRGDYIIKGVKGEIYPCKPDIFEATYDIVEDKTARWEDAIANAKFMLEEYKKIPTGGFGAITITQTIIRYENGERTDELLEELEGIE